jgi:hypothetical protein
MNLNRNPLRGNGCLRTDNKVLEMYLFQFNGVSFFGAFIEGKLIPMNPAGSVVVAGIAEKMGREDLDEIPKKLIGDVKEIVKTITCLNEKRPYLVNGYVFFTLKKRLVEKLTEENRNLITIQTKDLIPKPEEIQIVEEILSKNNIRIIGSNIASEKDSPTKVDFTKNGYSTEPFSNLKGAEKLYQMK